MVFTTGLTISMHYCGGKWVSASVIQKTDSCCGNACSNCENKTLHYEVEEDFVSPMVTEIIPAIELDMLFPLFFAINVGRTPLYGINKAVFDNASPPLPLHTRLSVLQTFLC